MEVADLRTNPHFFMLTGLTKLLKMNIFSVLNNLDDISFFGKNTDLIGYTQEEVKTNFSEEIEAIAKKQKKKTEQILQRMKEDYNGFNFGGQKLYNPWDINNFIKNEASDLTGRIRGSPVRLATI